MPALERLPPERNDALKWPLPMRTGQRRPTREGERSMLRAYRVASGWLTGRAHTVKGFRIALDPTAAVVPTGCACCGAPASLTLSERRRSDAKTLIVPYCESCHDHASTVATRTLALSLAALLLGLSTAVAVPLLWDWVTLPAYVAAVLLAAGLPAALGQVVRSGPGAKPHAPGKAVWWEGDGVLAGTNMAWARELATANRARVDSACVRERLWSPWMLSAAVVGLVAAPFWLSYQHASVRVLNLTDLPLRLSADGRQLALVEPSSAESPAAGVDVRVPAGRRILEVSTRAGHLVRRTSVFIQAGRQHLYAPASPAYCFWLETTTYDSDNPSQPQMEPLVGDDRFWVLPTQLDTWLAPNPPAASLGVRSTGGVLVALRQGRCEDAPSSTRLPSVGPKLE